VAQVSDPDVASPSARLPRTGRFPRNEIISLLDNYPTHNLGESTSQDLTFGDVLEVLGIDALRGLRLGYGTAVGDAVLRARVGELTGMQADQVITTQGVALGLYLLAVEHCRPGDEVLIVTPMFPPTRDAMIGSGVTVNTVPLGFDDGYHIDADVIAPALTPSTTLVCLASPQNPSGVRARPDEIAAVLAHMARVCPHALLLIDEIYRDATYGDTAVPLSFATADRRALLASAVQTVEHWQHGEAGRIDWVRPEGGAMCCIRLRPDTFDDAAVQRFWATLPEFDLQLGVGEWFGESARVARLGFGYLPLDRLPAALHQLSHALDRAERTHARS
jgi:bifunctional pyridoxal-dependent enzyme with beta-cystathionase and maltose regulon repressor activities